MNLESQPYYPEDDEITLKELIYKLQEFWQELWLYKWFIIVVAGLVSAAFLAKTMFLEETTYESYLSFTVNEEGEEKTSPVADLLGHYALNYNFDKIVALSKSSSIVNKLLLQQETIDGKKDFMGNHLIDIYELHEEWAEEEKKVEDASRILSNFYFVSNDINAFRAKDYRALNILHKKISGDKNTAGLMDISFDEKSTIFELSVNTINEDLSLILRDAIYKSISEFYIEGTVTRPLATFTALKVRKDSLASRINYLESQLAYFSDRTEGLLSNSYRLKIENIEREADRTNKQYAEVLKNVETIDFALQNKTPSFQVVDIDYIPKKITPSKVKAILLGGILGTFLAITFFIGRKIIIDAMRS